MGGISKKTEASAKKTSKTAKTTKTTKAASKSSTAKKDEAKVEKASGKSSVKAKSETKEKPVKAESLPAKSAEKVSAKKVVKDYDESQIKHLNALEHIRLRSGMYIGRLGDGSNQNDGIYVLLKEIIDNAIDEFIMGFGKKIDVSIKDNRVKVRDYGRGIPLGKVVECVSEINTGAKYNDEVFQFSVGMNGVGTKAVNALSSYFRVVSIRDVE